MFWKADARSHIPENPDLPLIFTVTPNVTPMRPRSGTARHWPRCQSSHSNAAIDGAASKRSFERSLEARFSRIDLIRSQLNCG